MSEPSWDWMSTAFSGVIQDGATAKTGLGKTGTGTLTLSGANTYSGPTRIQVGTLQTAADYVLSSASALTISAGATLDVGNTAQTVASLAGAGPAVCALTSDAVANDTSTAVPIRVALICAPLTLRT